MENLKEQIDCCKDCNLHKLTYNIKDVSKGTGKLHGWAVNPKNVKAFFIGMNPSWNRFPNLELAFGGYNYDKGTGVGFVKLLERLGVIDKCYVTNLVKCSTTDNKITEAQTKACLKHLTAEIKEYNPKVLVCMGNDAYNNVNLKFDKPTIKIWHPNYIFSYNRTKLKEYESQIMDIFEICN